MKPKSMTLTEQVLTEYLTGPEPGGKLRKCIICHEDLAAGERWLKMTRPDQYSVGAHTSCLAREGSKLDGAIAPERRFGPGVPVAVRP